MTRRKMAKKNNQKYSLDLIGSILDSVDGKVSTINEKVVSIDTRLLRLEGTVDTNAGKLEDVDKKVLVMNASLNGKLSEKIDKSVGSEMDSLSGRVIEIEKSVSASKVWQRIWLIVISASVIGIIKVLGDVLQAAK